MLKRKWLLLILAILLIAGYVRFFHKTWTETGVPSSADRIIAIDVKRVTNTLIWNYITSPSQWKKISFSPGKKTGWREMFTLPDYVFIFHVSGQPDNEWYSCLRIRDSAGFREGLTEYHFYEQSPQVYVSDSLGICIYLSGNKVLLGTASSVKDGNGLKVAGELFVQKKHITRKQLFKNIEASSHLSLVVRKNSVLTDDALVMLNFDDRNIHIEGNFSPVASIRTTEQNIGYNENALLSFGCSDVLTSVHHLLDTTARAKISKALNYNTDSVLLPGNRSYTLTLATIRSKTDSAVRFDYDENFNPVPKTVVNIVKEPVYSVVIRGDNAGRIFNYWDRNGQIEKSGDSSIFLPMPLVKSYCKIGLPSDLIVASEGFAQPKTQKMITCIAYLRLLFASVPGDVAKLFPPVLGRMANECEVAELILRKKKSKVVLEGKVSIKENGLFKF